MMLIADLVAFEERLRCPASGLEMTWLTRDCLATADKSRRYPVVDGIPILISDENPLLAKNDYTIDEVPVLADRGGQSARNCRSWLRKLRRALPSSSLNTVATTNLQYLAKLLERHGGAKPSSVLVIGGGTVGEGMGALLERDDIDTLETDVYIGPRTQVVCDVHNLPFVDGCFDAVICQAVLEHVIDPQLAVAEIHRVLRHKGFVYSEIPFMQQVHEGAFDFSRFTQVGHRNLFRAFDEVRSGATGGPGMALSWSVRYFAISLAGRSRTLGLLADAAATLLTFWLKYLDHFVNQRPSAIDAASGTYFLGRRRTLPVSEREVVASYRGGYSSPHR